MIFTKPDVLRPVVVPKYRSIPIFIIKMIYELLG